jgi:hypothetical protein
LGGLHERNDSGSGGKTNSYPQHSINQREVTISMSSQKFRGIAGLPLSRRAVRILKDGGIYAHSLLSVEHQELAKRYVIRGVESGGSGGDVGRYVTFAGVQGEPLECLHPIETIAVNGLHAVVISNAMLRADMLRKGRTYELLITHHWLGSATDGQKPRLECEIVFRGIHGRLELDLHRKDKAQAGRVVPAFYSLAGEEIALPNKFVGLVRAATRGVNCAGCSHTHYLRKPHPLGPSELNDSVKHNVADSEIHETLAS